MADVGQHAGHAAVPGDSYAESGATAWVGWVLFAGVIMVLTGFFHAIEGLVAIFDDGYYAVASSGLVVHVDYSGWGWVHLILGILVCAAGFGAALGQMWARVVGVILVSLSAILNMLFIAAFPVWSIIIITLDVIVIYALVVHSGELEDA